MGLGCGWFEAPKYLIPSITLEMGWQQRVGRERLHMTGKGEKPETDAAVSRSLQWQCELVAWPFLSTCRYRLCPGLDSSSADGSTG